MSEQAMTLKERAAELEPQFLQIVRARKAVANVTEYSAERDVATEQVKVFEAVHALVADLLAALETAENDALERAAKEVDKIASNTSDFDRDRRRGAGMASAAIRALKTGETP